MKTWIRGKSVVCGLVMVLGACGGDDEDGGGGSSVPGCADVCAKIAPLMCPADDSSTCQAECDSLDEQTPSCASQVRAFVACAAARPATDFACIDGEGELMDTACTAESNALAACALGGLAGMNGSGAGGSSGAGGAGTGGGTCEFTNDGECDEPDFCPVGTDTADCGG